MPVVKWKNIKYWETSDATVVCCYQPRTLRYVVF